jgi:predicted nucleic acid-binding protein
MKPVIADTGPLYAATDPDDQYHARAQRELRRVDRERRDVIVAYPTLLESYSLILYRLGTRVGLAWLGELMAGGALINPTAEDYREAAAKLKNYTDQTITLFDATLAILAARMGIEIWTYDHHFDVMSAPVWR